MRILIVDDEKNICTSLTNILKDEGYTVFVSNSGEKALQILKGEVIDLIFLDVRLPGIDGIDVLENVKKSCPETDVIMISGHGDIETAVKAVKMGAYEFLEKPLSLPQITISVKNIVENRKLSQKYFLEKEDWDAQHRIIGISNEINHIRDVIKRTAATDSKVLICGESGTGKELVAYAIHNNSKRNNGPFVKFNSAAIPLNLVESELFGHEKGAFTGAEKKKLGKLEIAHEGTLFLDEIGDMNLEVQAKILRVIEEGKFERIGTNKTIDIDVRILAATNRNLEEMIKDDTFREDLFFRLNVLPIKIQPLRYRKDDIPVLIDYYLKYYSRELKVTCKKFSENAINLLNNYHFPGNVRELKNLVERLYILTAREIISEAEVKPHLNIGTTQKDGLFQFSETKNFSEIKREFERNYLLNQLNKFNWNITLVAKKLGMQQPNLSRKIKELGIKKLT